MSMRAGELARSGTSPIPRVLEAPAEWMLWRRAAAGLLSELEDSGAPTLSADDLADLLQASAQLASEWDIDLNALSNDPSREARWLSRAAIEVTRLAAEAHAIPAFAACSILRVHGLAHDAVEECRVGDLPPMLERWVGERWQRVTELATPAARVRCSVALDPDEELLRAAHWCRRRLERDPWARLLIVVPDLGARRAALERTFRQILMPRSTMQVERTAPVFFVEGGRALSDYAEPAEALALLRALASRGDDQVLAGILEARCWGRSGEPSRARVAARLRRRMGERHIPQGYPARLRQLVTDPEDQPAIERCASAIEHAVAALNAMDSAAGGWPAALTRALNALGFPWDGELDSDRDQLRRHFDQWLIQIRQCLAVVPASRPGEAIELLRQLARRERFAPSSGDAAVTITPALEAPVVRYDGIRVLGLQADRWPQPVHADPLLPWTLQRDLGLVAASPQTRLAAARLAMQRWLESADEVVWSFARGEGDALWQPSPLLEPWLTEAHSKPPHRIAPQVSLAARLRSARALQLDVVRETIGAPLATGSVIPGGSYALTDQLECAFRAYARHRLHAREEDVAEPGVSPLSRGRFLHQVLYHLWGELQHSSRLTDHVGVRVALERAVERAAADPLFSIPEPGWQRVVQRERSRAIRLVGALLADEAARVPFEVIAREEALECVLGEARLALRIDRIDRLADGSYAVIDYKTGLRRALHFSGDRFDTVQLWLYALAAEQSEDVDAHVEALANLHLVAAGKRWAGVRSETATLEPLKVADDWHALRDPARELLGSLAQDFMAGQASVAPRSNACRYCDLTSVCRRVEWRAGGSGVDDVEDEAEESDS